MKVRWRGHQRNIVTSFCSSYILCMQPLCPRCAQCPTGYFLCPSSPANLYHLACRLVVAPQDGPASPVGLDKRHFELGAENPKLALFGLDGREQGELGLVPLAIACGQIELHTRRLEIHRCRRLVNLLEVKRCDHRRGCLVKVVSGPLSAR